MADPRPKAGPATGPALKAALKAALAVPTGPDGVASPNQPPAPPTTAVQPSAGAGGAAREKTIMGVVEGMQDPHSVGDPNAPSNAGKTAQSSDHWNSY